ncbi:DivIVA domain-containing protein [Streptomyces sp. NPDC057900]|uniref:DivIVA domain-containing protein n=1 Tax=Streptomyces sp. NPDC057900 TaxID=3346274 RepID=UPI0036F158C6
MFWSRGSREAREEYEPPLHEEFGFTIARRGYDRDQVDAYITRLRGGTPPAGVVAFELVRRGYEQSRVDEVIARLHGEAGRKK